MRSSMVNTINSWIDSILNEERDSTWEIEGSVSIDPPTVTELDEAFDRIQSEAIKEDARQDEQKRIRNIPAFRMLVIE